MTNQLTLTDDEVRAIHDLSASVGQSPETILHAAIEQFLARHRQQNRLEAMRAARGIWSDRDDVPDLRELRDEWERKQS